MRARDSRQHGIARDSDARTAQREGSKIAPPAALVSKSLTTYSLCSAEMPCAAALARRSEGVLRHPPSPIPPQSKRGAASPKADRYARRNG